MTIDTLDAVMNSPLRVLTVKDQAQIKKDLSYLIQSPMLMNMWVDGSGHIHQKIDIVSFTSFFCAMLDRINQLISGLSLDDESKVEFLVIKSKEILDLYVPLVTRQETEFGSTDSGKIARLESLRAHIELLGSKVKANPKIFAERKAEISAIVDKLIAECYFDQIMKTASVGSARFNDLSVHQKFLLLSPADLKPIHFTRDHVAMIRRLLATAPETLTDELIAHAARHFCALQKATKDEKLLVALDCAQQTVHKDELVIAAKEFKVIPLALKDNAVKLASILAGLICGDKEFASQVDTRLQLVVGGQEQLDKLVETEAKLLENPETQEKYFRRILFLEQVSPHSEKLDAVIQYLELLAIYGDLPKSCVQQLVSRGRITLQISQSFHQAQELSPQEKVKTLKDLLPVAMTLFAKSENVEVSELIDQIVLKLFEFASREEAEAIISSAISDSIYTGDIIKSERILGAVLATYSLLQTSELVHFFSKISSTFFNSTEGLSVVSRVAESLIAGLSTNEFSLIALCLLHREIAMKLKNSKQDKLQELETKIVDEINLASTKQKKLDASFKVAMSHLLSHETGIDDLELLIKSKIKQMGKSREASINYLGIFHAEISTRLSNTPNLGLRDLKEVIEQALDVANSGQVLSSMKKPCVTNAALMDVQTRATSQDFKKYLYNPDGTLKQEPFKRPA